MLSKETYLKKLADFLAIFQAGLSMRGQMALFDMNVIAEDIIKEMLNIALDLHLVNLNRDTFNHPGVDLGDETNRVAVQVTSTKTTKKIQSTVKAFLEQELYKKYSTLLVFILKTKQRRYKKFNTSNLFDFDSKEHIWDFEKFAQHAQSLNTKKLKQIVDYLEQELPISSKHDGHVREEAFPRKFLDQITRWFEILGYSIEKESIKLEDEQFNMIINIPVRRGYDRIFVRGVSGVAETKDFKLIQSEMKIFQVDEGWLVSARRVAPSLRNVISDYKEENIYCYTVDELIDEEADFSSYIEWLESEITRLGINDNYVDIACTRDEIDPQTKEKVTVSKYDRSNGWIDGYIDQWLDDPAKEHISVLGQFGMGKTWFALHYAWKSIQRYKDAKRRGIGRPRLPLYIPLRDYAKAVNIESLFSEFFFRKHEIPIKGYSVFEELNRMGKFLLIFDGFDEMASQIDRQKMINNFWQLARAVVPGTKVILTCRTEHFPEAKEGRSLLSAELLASVSKLTGEPPQFEVLELAPFDDIQIRKLLSSYIGKDDISRILDDPRLLNLARRPVMTELILDALPEIKSTKSINMARIYFYAVQRKMDRDIKAERTFTSLVDKLYFLCELSWEMFVSDKMQINYKEFPKRLTRLFPYDVKEQKDLDHWHYDMMGQTMLIRNSDGDYSPAHRSLLEFFVAYKLAAQLGGLSSELLVDIFPQPPKDEFKEAMLQKFTWSSYFHSDPNNGELKERRYLPLKTFDNESIDVLKDTFGNRVLSEALIEFLVDMVDAECLWRVVYQTQNRTFEETRYSGGNAMTLLRRMNPNMANKSLSSTVLVGANLFNADLTATDLSGANLERANLSGCTLAGTDMRSANLTSIQIGEMGKVLALAWHPSGRWLISASDNENLYLWNMETLEQRVIHKSESGSFSRLSWSEDGKLLAALSEIGVVKIWHFHNQSELKEVFKENFKTPVYSLVMSRGEFPKIAIGQFNGEVKILDTRQSVIKTLSIPRIVSPVTSIALSNDNKLIAIGYQNGKVQIVELSENHVIAEIANSVAPVTYLEINEQNTTVGIYRGKLKIEVGGLLPKYLADEVQELIEGYLDDAEEIYEQYYQDNELEFNKVFEKELEGELSQWDLLLLKREFFKNENPEGFSELVYWARAEALEYLSDDDENLFEDTENEYFAMTKHFFAGFWEEWNINTKQRNVFNWSLSHEGASVVKLNEQYYSVGKSNGTLLIWDKHFKDVIKSITAHTQPILAQSLHKFSGNLATGSADATIKIWTSKNNVPDYIGDCKELKIKMNCENLQLIGALGLTALSPDKSNTLRNWFLNRGAIVEDNPG